MARPKRSEATKLALALEELHAQIGPNQGVVRGQQIKNATRVFLLEKGFLREILSRGGTSFQTQVLTRATARCFTLTSGNIWRIIWKIDLVLNIAYRRNPPCYGIPNAMLSHGRSKRFWMSTKVRSRIW
ncbi:hypothetical protein GL267_010790 [Acidithiobacillus ferrianus]|uniref:Uncharacterized protein n=2 Tax=Acidithiobacillus ferrianus TaxID=2678518 RepID=A0A845UBL7_9PROT|nr:hypothetical protein [Acidithiobacillus ferrianus]NDU43157.1 hypothetical protein [Acidithiobacillus ferrianus]